MLTAPVARYVALRQTLGFTLRDTARALHAFARFAAARGDRHVRSSTAVAWATLVPSPTARHTRLQRVVRFARFVHAEDPAHEIPPSTLFRAPTVRSLPYIYTPEEVAHLVAAAARLRNTYPLRRQAYATLFGLIAATGLRVSEALDLRLDDVRPDGVLQIRRTKFGKSRLVPLHPTVTEALDRYLDRRCRRWAVADDHVFLSAGNRRISSSTVEYTFRRMRQLAGIAPARPRHAGLRPLLGELGRSSRRHRESNSLPRLSPRRDPKPAGGRDPHRAQHVEHRDRRQCIARVRAENAPARHAGSRHRDHTS